MKGPNRTVCFTHYNFGLGGIYRSTARLIRHSLGALNGRLARGVVTLLDVPSKRANWPIDDENSGTSVGRHEMCNLGIEPITS